MCCCIAGGAFVLEQLQGLLQHDKQYQQYSSRVAGVVYDSAPCYMHLTAGATAIGHGRSLLVRMAAAALFFLSAALMSLVAPLRPRRFW